MIGVITSVELVRSEAVQVHATLRIPTLQIDICKGVEIFVTREADNANVKIVTANSTEVKLNIKSKEDPKKFDVYPIPTSIFTEQRITQVAKDGSKLEFHLVSTAADSLKKEGVISIESPRDTREKSGNVEVEFELEYKTTFGEVLFIIGSIKEMGSWNLGEAKRMEWNYGGIWKIKLVLPREKLPCEYKYLMLNTFTKSISWEQTSNRTIHIPVSYMGPTAKQKDNWEA